MNVEPHDLERDFPQYKDAIQQRKQSDEHFAELCQRYRTLDREICRLENIEAPVSDLTLEEKKKERLFLKDRLYELLKAG